MRLRLVVAGSAVVMLAAAGFIPAAASNHVIETAGAAGATKTICVGLVLDPRAIGGSVSDGCVHVAPGTTGVGVLEAAGHSVTFRQDGLLCTIDDVPSSGCSAVDNSHYWAYYHRAPDRTTWSYSVEDSRTYRPVNRSTEGWVYDDGSSLKPDNIPAGQICAGLVKPTPAPTRTPTRTPPAATHRHAAGATPSASTSPTSPRTSRSATTGTGRPHRSRSSAPSPGVTTPGGSPPPSATPAPGTEAASGHGNATGALVAAGVIAVIAGATVIGARRRRR